MSQVKKDLKYYMRLPFTLRVEPVVDPDDGYYWIAQYEELPGCKTDGGTEAEAIANVQGLFDEYVTMRIEEAKEIPEPAQPPMTPATLVWTSVPQEKMSPLPRFKDAPFSQGTLSEGMPILASRSHAEIAEVA